MPNIELIGFPDRDMDHLVQQIARFFREAPFAKDMVITRSRSSVTDMAGDPSPFIRVYNTNRKEGERIAEALSIVGLDVEVVVLTAFHEAKKLEEPNPFKGPLWRNTAGAWPRRTD